MTEDRRKELRFRLGFSLVGLVFWAVGLIAQGWPPSPALIEVFGVAGLFFSGTAIWSWRQLSRQD